VVRAVNDVAPNLLCLREHVFNDSSLFPFIYGNKYNSLIDPESPLRILTQAPSFSQSGFCSYYRQLVSFLLISNENLTCEVWWINSRTLVDIKTFSSPL
jgi:hypothetical protein